MPWPEKVLVWKTKKCQGIHSWHVIKIEVEGNHIQVADSVNDVFRNHNILFNNNKDWIDEEIEIINPDGLTSARKEELEYFEPYVDTIHKSYISCDY